MSPFQGLNQQRINTFNRRAKFHVRDAFGLDLKNREQSLDFARSLLTEYSDTMKTPESDADANEQAAYKIFMARLAITTRFLEGESESVLQAELKKMVAVGDVSQKERHLREFTLKMAGAAARSLKERLEDDISEPTPIDLEDSDIVDEPVKQKFQKKTQAAQN